MNWKQKLVLMLGIAIFVIMGIYPPWVLRFGSNAYPQTAVGPYAPITEYTEFSDRNRGTYLKYIDLYRLGVQWIMVVVVTGGLIVVLKDKKT